MGATSATAGAPSDTSGAAGASGAAATGGCYRDPYLPDDFELPCDQPDPIANCTDGWCTIEPGCFFMGSPWCEWSRARDTANPIQVTLTHRYRIQQFELTQAEWTGLDVPNPSSEEDENSNCLAPDCPVGRVNWYEALAFANLRSRAEGLPDCYDLDDCTGELGAGMECGSVSQTTASMYDCTGYRLPTGPEWEYAARAGTRTTVYSGDVWFPEPPGWRCESSPALDPIAWYCVNSQSSSHPVALKDPNAWGLYDMIGNVFEWTSTLATLQAGGPYVDYGADLLKPDGIGVLGWSPELRGGYFSGPPDVHSAGKSLGGVPREKGTGNGARLVQTLSAAAENR